GRPDGVRHTPGEWVSARNDGRGNSDVAAGRPGSRRLLVERYLDACSAAWPQRSSPGPPTGPRLAPPVRVESSLGRVEADHYQAGGPAVRVPGCPPGPGGSADDPPAGELRWGAAPADPRRGGCARRGLPRSLGRGAAAGIAITRNPRTSRPTQSFARRDRAGVAHPWGT